MGTWGTDAFDNDTAADFAYAVADRKDLERVEEALNRVVDAENGDLEAPDAEEALVAAEVVARLQGRFGARNAYTETVDAWVAAHPLRPSAALVQKAVAAIDRVLEEPSELLELWKESDEFEAWKSGVMQLRTRVKGP